METSLLDSALRPRQVKVDRPGFYWLQFVPPEEGVRGRRKSQCVFV